MKCIKRDALYRDIKAKTPFGQLRIIIFIHQGWFFKWKD